MREFRALTAHDARAIGTADAMRIVAVGGQAAFGAGEGQPVGTGGHERLARLLVALIVVVAVLLVREEAVLVVTAELLRVLASALLGPGCEIAEPGGADVAETKGEDEEPETVARVSKGDDVKRRSTKGWTFFFARQQGRQGKERQRSVQVFLPSWAQRRSEKTAITFGVVMSSERLQRRAPGRNTNQ